MKAAHFSFLLPEAFRHKSTRVRVFKPKAILLDFHGTISERRWEEKVIFPYVKKALPEYLKSNWDSDEVQKCVTNLRIESFEQGFKNRYEDAPIIDEPSDQSHGNQADLTQMAQQAANFVLWQINSRKETRDTQAIQRLVWIDGFRRGLIKVPIYPDVMRTVRRWSEHYKCLIYMISSLDSSTLKLFLENTDHGDLHQFMSLYLGARKPGDKLLSETYKSLYEKISSSSAQVFRSPTDLNSKTISPSLSSTGESSLESKRISIPKARSKSSPSTSNRNDLARSPSGSLSKLISARDSSERPILFISDSGQEAKAASFVLDGAVYECLLINRPGNRRIRSYYLSQFQYIEQFDDIQFV